MLMKRRDYFISFHGKDEEGAQRRKREIRTGKLLFALVLY